MNLKAFVSILELLILFFLFSFFLLFFSLNNSQLNEKLLELNALQKEHDLLNVWLSDFENLNLNEMLSDAKFVFPNKTIELSFDDSFIRFDGITKKKPIKAEAYFFDLQLKEHFIQLKVFLE